VRTLFLFTENDSGLKVFQQQFRPRDVEGAKVVVIPGGDHALSESATQQAVVQEMVDFVLASERERPAVRPGPLPPGPARDRELETHSSYQPSEDTTFSVMAREGGPSTIF
jgi:hypothetical protein